MICSSFKVLSLYFFVGVLVSLSFTERPGLVRGPLSLKTWPRLQTRSPIIYPFPLLPKHIFRFQISTLSHTTKTPSSQTPTSFPTKEIPTQSSNWALFNRTPLGTYVKPSDLNSTSVPRGPPHPNRYGQSPNCPSLNVKSFWSDYLQISYLTTPFRSFVLPFSEKELYIQSETLQSQYPLFLFLGQRDITPTSPHRRPRTEPRISYEVGAPEILQVETQGEYKWV